jgi:predicted nucleotidyltransferase
MTSELDARDRVIVDCLRQPLDELVVEYRFGSTAAGTTSRTSDIDVAGLLRAHIPSARRFDAQERLAGRLDGDVDFVDLRAASPVVAIQVIAICGRRRSVRYSETVATG